MGIAERNANVRVWAILHHSRGHSGAEIRSLALARLTEWNLMLPGVCGTLIVPGTRAAHPTKGKQQEQNRSPPRAAKLARHAFPLSHFYGQ